MVETESINAILKSIPKQMITELNDLIFAGVKLRDIKKLRKQGTVHRKNIEVHKLMIRRKKTTTKESDNITEKIAENILAKEGKRKRYQIKQYKAGFS